MINLINIDCVKYLESVDDNKFDLAIIDPPYGINIDNKKSGNLVMTKHESFEFDKRPPGSYFFNLLFRKTKNQIIFGYNHFILPPKKGIICWDKCNPMTGKFSDFELAWTSHGKCNRIYKKPWIGFGRTFQEKKPSIHPCQKPINLYKWILDNYAKKSDSIFDSHLGSGSLAVACSDLGFDFIGCEINKSYFESAKKRLKEHESALQIFKS